MEIAAEPRCAQKASHENFADPDYEELKEKHNDVHSKMCIPSGTFREIALGLSCVIGAMLFVILNLRLNQSYVAHLLSQSCHILSMCKARRRCT